MTVAKHTGSEAEVVKEGACVMCDACCRTHVHVREGKVVKIDMLDENIKNTCPRAKAQLDFIYHPERLRYPLKRIGERGGGKFTRISWDEALDAVAGGFQKIKDEHGPESVVFYVSLPKEPRPYLHRLTHAFGSPNYCTESSNCMTAMWLATVLNFGENFSNFLGQGRGMDPATKCKLIWSSSVRHTSPALWKDYVAAKKRGVKIITVDPRCHELAEIADIHLHLRPGTDGALALGMINLIINEQLYDKEFVEKWTVGFEDLKELAAEYPLEKVEQITWVPASKIREATLLYATTKPASIRPSTDAVVHCSNGVQNERALLLLAALTGNLDVPGGNMGGVFGEPPLGIPVNDISLHERVADMPPGLGTDRFPVWTTLVKQMQSNVIAERIESGKPYPIKALLGAGLNMTFFADSERVTETFKKLDMIVAIDYFHNTGTQIADIVLPIASWLERPLLTGRPGGYISLIQPAIEPVGECWLEWKIYAELAKRWGFGDVYWNGDQEKCFDYMLEPVGITVASLKQHPEGLKANLPAREPKAYEQDGFSTPSGKVEIASSILAEYGYNPLPAYQEPAESPVSRPDLAESYPLVMTTGARTVIYTNSQYRQIRRLRKALPEALVEINPADAEPRGIKSGDMVKISSPRGSIKVKATVGDVVIPGVVHMMHHWPGEANVNLLTSGQDFDPISGFAAFKSLLCQVAKA